MSESLYCFILQCQKAYTVLYFNVRKLILFYTSMSESLYTVLYFNVRKRILYYTSMSESLYCSLLLALHETLCL